MTREETFHDGAKKEGAPALERKLIDLQLDLQTAPERNRPRRRKTAHEPPRARRLQALDLLAHSGIAGRSVDFQHLAKCSSPLAFIRLVAPTTPQARMAEIAQHGSGFVYLISRRGVTGVRDQLPVELPDTIQRLRRATDLPICVGFGVSRPEQARAIAALADGVVVGSAIVKAADESVASAVTLAASLRAAIDTVSP